MAEVETASRIIRDLKDIPVGQIFTLVTASVAVVAGSRRLLPSIAARLPPAVRPFLLPWPPLIRLFLTVTVTLSCVAMVVRPEAGAVFALLGSTAVAVGFAVKDYVSSMVAGVVVLFEQPYAVGDWIRIGEHYGEVVALDFRAVVLITADDDRITIPHGKIWTEPVSNATGGLLRLQIQTYFYLAPDHDAKAAAAALRDVTLTSPFLAYERPVAIRVTQTPWATKYCVRAYPIESRNQFLFQTDVTMRGREALAALGIELAQDPMARGAPDAS